MATKYWIAKNSSWSGPTGAGDENSPYLGAIAVRTAIGAAAIVAGDTIVFMGEYGPVLLAELLADWAIGTTFQTITTPVTYTATLPAPTDTTNFRGGILFGTSAGFASNIAGMHFVFRGDNHDWHIDARGAASAAQRMQAAITFQGCNVDVTGLRVAAPNWDYTVTSGRVPASNTSYAYDVSRENMGLIMWGGVNCIIDGVTCWGSDLWCPRACYVAWNATAANSASADGGLSEVKNSVFYGAATCFEYAAEGFLVNGGLSYPERIEYGVGATVDIHDNIAHGATWGTGGVNQAWYVGGPMSVQSMSGFGSVIYVRRNEVYGNCQDGLQVIGIGVDVCDNYVHDLNPGKTPSDTFTRYNWDGTAVWATTSQGYIGDGIKLGLSGYDNTAPSATWLTLGTSGGNFNVDQLRNACYRNRVINPCNYGITTNGSSGMLIMFNEVYGGYRGLSIGSVAVGDQGQFYVANNYLQGSDRGCEINNRSTVYAYNNIFRSPGYDLGAAAATGSSIYGDNNIFWNNLSTFGTTVNNLTNTITVAAAYTPLVGPTAGGNCDGTGRPYGLEGARSPTRVLRDVGRNIVPSTTPPIGPRV